MTSGTIHTTLFIQSPQLFYTAEVDVNYSEQVSHLLLKYLSPMGISDIAPYNLFLLSKDFLLIDKETHLSKVSFLNVNTCYVLYGESFRTTVHFETKKITVDVLKSWLVFNLAYVVSQILQLNQSTFVMVKGSSGEIVSFDQPIESFCWIVKETKFFGKNLIFLGEETSTYPMSNMLVVTKSVCSKKIKSIFTKLYTEFRISKPLEFSIAEINQSRMQKLYQDFIGSAGVSEFSITESFSFLLCLLNSAPEPLIPKRLQQVAFRLLRIPNFIPLLAAFFQVIPLSTHALLLELLQIFGGIFNFPGSDVLVNILRKILFGLDVDAKLSTHFVKRLFIFGLPIVKVSQKKEFKLYSVGPQIVVHENPLNIAYNERGLSKNPKFAMWSELELPNVEDCLGYLVEEKTNQVSNALLELNSALNEYSEVVKDVQKYSDEILFILNNYGSEY